MAPTEADYAKQVAGKSRVCMVRGCFRASLRFMDMSGRDRGARDGGFFRILTALKPTAGMQVLRTAGGRLGFAVGPGGDRAGCWSFGRVRWPNARTVGFLERFLSGSGHRKGGDASQ